VNVSDMYKTGWTNIFSADESQFSNVQKLLPVISPKRQNRLELPQVLTEDETLVSCAMTVSGLFVLPMFNAPHVLISPLSAEDPPGSIYMCSKSQWMNKDLFLIWLKNFILNTSLPFRIPLFWSWTSTPVIHFCQVTTFVRTVGSLWFPTFTYIQYL